MKQIIFTLASLLMITSACKKTVTETKWPTDDKIFLCGVNKKSTLAENEAAYWHNGLQSLLPAGNAKAEAYNMAISAAGVPISVGAVYENGGARAIAWTDSTGLYLSPLGVNSRALDIEIVGQDIYICGSKGDPGKERPVLWVNFIPTYLNDAISTTGAASALKIINGDVYVACNEFYIGSSISFPKVYKNGVGQALSPAIDFETITDIDVINGDVYGVGDRFANNIHQPIFYKNDIRDTIAGQGESFYGHSIAVVNKTNSTGVDIYIAGGKIINGEMNISLLKNNADVPLQSINENGECKKVKVINNDVYACGFKTEGDRYMACYWKNITLFTNNMVNSPDNSVALGMAIK
jgi:hypothetical protein